MIYCGISSSSNRSLWMLSKLDCPAGSAQEGISSKEATERSSSETAGGCLWSDSTLLITLGLSVSSCTEDKATDTENPKQEETQKLMRRVVEKSTTNPLIANTKVDV